MAQSTFYRCAKGHVFPGYVEMIPTCCYHCHPEETPVRPLVEAEEMLEAAETALGHDLERQHILADQALLTKLRPSAPEFVAQYERLKDAFWYA